MEPQQMEVDHAAFDEMRPNDEHSDKFDDETVSAIDDDDLGSELDKEIDDELKELEAIRKKEEEKIAAKEEQIEEQFQEPPPDYETLTLMMKEYRERLYRRTKLMEEMRRSYLKDVVALKHVLNDVLKDTEREHAITQLNAAIPSLDLRQTLAPHAPEHSAFNIKPCESCGGQLEITLNVSERLQELTEALAVMKKNEQNLKLTIATQNYKFDNLALEKEQQDKKHAEEVIN
jgi:type I site-specific restriction endonuclease